MTPIENVFSKIEGLKPSGDSGRQWVGCCPAHPDQHQSLGVGVADNGNVLITCYAGCQTADICAAVGLTLRDLYPIPEDGTGITLGRLAFYKRLPVNWLKSLGLRQIPGRNAVEIPYLDEDGKELFARTRDSRRAKDGTKQPTGTKLRPYGLNRLKESRERGETTLFLVEGESDCWSLWFHGFAALGIPGAAAVKVLEPDNLAGFTSVLVWSEPDAGGDGFAAKAVARLTEIGYAGEVRVHKATKDAKDPADIAAQLVDQFPAAMKNIVAAAAPVTPGGASPGTPPGGPARIPPTVIAAGFGSSPYPWGQFPFTDTGNAARLHHLSGEDLLFVDPWDRWYVWDGVRWANDITLKVEALTARAIQGIWWESQVAPSRSAAEAAERWWLSSQSAGRQAACVSLARVPVATDYHMFDQKPDLFVAANGTVNLRTGELRPSRRDDLITLASPVRYNPDAECPVWERMLEQIFTSNPDDPALPPDRDLVEFFQRLSGVFLTGRTPTILPIFHGAGSNGKSLVINAFTDIVGPDYSVSVNPTMLMESATERHPTELADFYGKRVVFTSETKQGAHLNAGLVKRLTGGDRIRARRMREDHWEFSPTHTLVLSTNHKPHVSADDPAIWRRIALIPFKVKFWNPERPDETGPDHLVQDKTLPDRLKAEYEGILAWMVRGAMAFLQGGLAIPAAVSSETLSYRDSEDLIGQFLAERTIQSKAAVTLKATLYKAYSQWASDLGLRPASSKKFTDVLRGKGIKDERTNASRMWIGIELHEDDQEPADLDAAFN